jgi:hypothetical protein
LPAAPTQEEQSIADFKMDVAHMAPAVLFYPDQLESVLREQDTHVELVFPGQTAVLFLRTFRVDVVPKEQGRGVPS